MSEGHSLAGDARYRWCRRRPGRYPLTDLTSALPSLTVGLLTLGSQPITCAVASLETEKSGRASKTSSAYFTFPNGAET